MSLPRPPSTRVRAARRAAGAVSLLVLSGSLLTACGAKARVDALGEAVALIDFAGDAAAAATADARKHDALAAARAAVAGAVGDAYPDPDRFRRQAFLAAVATDDIATAALLVHFWQPEPTDTGAVAAYVRLLGLTGRADVAVELAWDAVVATPELRATLVPVWYEALAADNELMPPPDPPFTPGSRVTALEPFQGSSSVIFKVRRGSETVGVFKPHQTVRHQSYRGEIAAYRLCALIHCTLTIPSSREARVRESDFRALTGLGPRDPTTFYARNSDVVFFTDDEGTRWLFGVVKDWVPDFCRFPIEYVDVWETLVRVGADPERLRGRSVRQVLAELDGRERGFYRRIVARAEDTSAYELARQLSELHVFDLLINNFDRYQPDWYGMNAHWTDGRFVAIDNGASFHTTEEFNWRAVQRRIRPVQVFSRSMIDALRWMDDEAAFGLLFPPSPFHDDDDDRFACFVERREWLLAYVDGLVAEHGEDAVYLFP